MAEREPTETGRRVVAKMFEYSNKLDLTDEERSFVARVGRGLDPNSVLHEWENARLAGDDLRPLVIKAVFATLLIGAEQVVRDLQGEQPEQHPLN